MELPDTRCTQTLAAGQSRLQVTVAVARPFSSFWSLVLPTRCSRFDPMALLPAHVRPCLA